MDWCSLLSCDALAAQKGDAPNLPSTLCAILITPFLGRLCVWVHSYLVLLSQALVLHLILGIYNCLL